MYRQICMRTSQADVIIRIGIALIFPDTSPRGAGIEGEDTDWDFGTGELLQRRPSNIVINSFFDHYERCWILFECYSSQI